MARKKKPKFVPTAEQEAALRDYKEWAGDSWQADLQRDFMRAGSEWRGSWYLLQQVRNSPGGIEWAMGERNNNPVPTSNIKKLKAKLLR